MLPEQFGELQPIEFMQQWEGYRWRQRQQENTMAYFTAHLMNVSGKTLNNPITAKDILKPLRGEEEKASRQADEEYLKDIFKLKE